MSGRVKAPALGGSNQYGIYSTCPCFVDECFQTGHKRVVSSFSRTFLLLIVMSELHEEIIAFLHLAQCFFQTSCSYKSIGRFTGFRIIGNANICSEEMRNHLSPASPRLVVLVDYCTVTAQKDCDNRRIGRFDTDTLAYRCISIEFQCQFIIPVQFRFLTGLDSYIFFFGNTRVTFIDDKCFVYELSFFSWQVFNKQPA